MTEHGDERVAASWPPPHPSPPLPPPREYGVPGTAPDRRPLIAGGAAVAVLVVVVLVLVLFVFGGDDSDDQPAPVARDTTSAEATPTATTPAAPYTCWNGSGAAAVGDCPEPDGEAGLQWVFPAMADARCGKAAAAGGPGVVTRVLCIYRAADGTKVQLGYFQWGSVDQGVAFYDAQGLTRTDAPDASGQVSLHTWSGGAGGTTKTASLYADEPFSVTTTYPAGASLSAADQAALAPRPPDQLRGAPAQ